MNEKTREDYMYGLRIGIILSFFDVLANMIEFRTVYYTVLLSFAYRTMKHAIEKYPDLCMNATRRKITVFARYYIPVTTLYLLPFLIMLPISSAESTQILAILFMIIFSLSMYFLGFFAVFKFFLYKEKKRRDAASS
jgi:hypothetical protein